MTTNDGGVLLGSNCPESYYGPALGGWSLFCVLDDVPDEPDADTSVRNARQRAMGIDYARENLERIPVVVVARVARLLDLYALDNLVVQDVGEERERWASWAGIVCFWILAPLAVVGLLRIRRSHRAVLVAPVVVSLATAVLFYGAHRMRISAEPSIVVGAAVSLSAGWSRLCMATRGDHRGRRAGADPEAGSERPSPLSAPASSSTTTSIPARWRSLN
jgi:hypothetical protein